MWLLINLAEVPVVANIVVVPTTATTFAVSLPLSRQTNQAEPRSAKRPHQRGDVIPRMPILCAFGSGSGICPIQYLLSRGLASGAAGKADESEI
jgi:hypothetical protein